MPLILRAREGRSLIGTNPMQLDRVTLEHVRDVARTEGRTQAEALRQLISEAISARCRNGSAMTTPVPQVDDASNTARQCRDHVRARPCSLCTRGAGDQEQRSISSSASPTLPHDN